MRQKTQVNQPKLKGLLTTDPELINHIRDANLIVNTTPIGMSGMNSKNNQSLEMPLGGKIWHNLQAKTTLYDLIYIPRPTAWLTLGAEKGCNHINGLEMLIQQGAASLRLWSKTEDIPIDVMRTAAEKHLNS